MASSPKYLASLAILMVLLPIIAKGDEISPAFPPFFDNICDEVECGRGDCRNSSGSPFNFVCECEEGWRRTRLDEEDNLPFLPCTIPNCTLDYSCMPAPPPSPSIPNNFSIFDPCYRTYCGEGTCTKNRTYVHTCQCNPGYQNLLNISVFPCYSECAIGSDCARLGIVSRSESNPSGDDDDSQATSFLPGKFHWISIFLISTAMALWK